jgi:hypothetical protein
MVMRALAPEGARPGRARSLDYDARMADDRHARMARNESRFRELNEALHSSVHAPAAIGGDRSGFVCECALPDCLEVVSVPLPRYEEIRSDSLLFVVAPGHEFPDAENVVDRTSGYVVVRKHDDVADIVEAGDPRT